MAHMKETSSVMGGRRFLRTVRALQLASRYHARQERRSGALHVDHLIGVAILLHRCGVRDDVTLALALLQDIYAKPDKDVSRSEVEQVGKDVATLVDAMTRKEGEDIRERYARIEQNIRTVLVQAADRALNTADMLNVYPSGIMERYCRDTRKHLLPMIERVIKRQPRNRHRAVLRKLKLRIEQNVLNAELHSRTPIQRMVHLISRQMRRER